MILFPLIGMSPLGGSSEAREVHIAALMLRTGEWILPLRDGILPSKPPLFHWISAALGALSGDVTPFVARLTSLLFGAGILFLTVRLTTALAYIAGAPYRAVRTELGLLSALILTTTYGFEHMHGSAMVDMTFSFFVTLALASLLEVMIWQEQFGETMEERVSRWNFLPFFMSAALATLAKGPIGIVLPGLIAGTWLVWLFGLSSALRAFAAPRLAWLFFFLIVTPWYVFAFLQGGYDFIGRQLVFENMQRLTGGDLMNAQPPWFYLTSFLHSATPWCLVFFVGLPFLYGASQRIPGQSAVSWERRRLLFLPVIWVLAGLLFFSIPSGKRHSYLLPLFPGMSISLAFMVNDLWRRLEDRTQLRLRAVLGMVPAFLFTLGLLLLLAFESLLAMRTALPALSFEIVAWLWTVRLPVRVVLSVVVVLNALLLMRHPQRMLVRSVLGWWSGIALIACVIFAGSGVKNSLKGFVPQATSINSARAGQPLFVVRRERDEFFDALMYYLDGNVQVVSPDILTMPCRGLYLSRADWFSRFVAHAQQRNWTTEELGRYNEIDDQIRGARDREKVLFRCARLPRSS